MMCISRSFSWRGKKEGVHEAVEMKLRWKGWCELMPSELELRCGLPMLVCKLLDLVFK